jgi:hypothetical protein
MQGIYTYIPETNYVSWEYRHKVVQIWPGLVRLVHTQISPGHIWTTLYFLNKFQIILAATIITGITFVFIFRVRCTSIVRSSYFRKFSDSSLSHFRLLKLQHLLAYMLIFRCHRL